MSSNNRREALHNKVTYDEDAHVHLGYYEDGHDFEAIALKVSEEKAWHVFFAFAQYGLGIPHSLKRARHEPEFGTLIFTTSSGTRAQKEFTRWVEGEVLPQLQPR